MYTLKSIVQRGTALGATFAVIAAAVVPVAPVFADALNPLTERSLLLSSSAPGFMDSDGSGNSENNLNANDPDGAGPLTGEYYALPGSGPNGKKSGETFSFRVSTDSSAAGTNVPIQAFSLQYCTSAAGNCQAPGNNSGDARTPNRMTNAAAHALPEGTKTSDFDVVTDGTTPWVEDTIATVPGTPGTYRVLVNGVQDTGWAMSATNNEDDAHTGALTGKNNFITLTKTAGVAPVFNDKIELKFTPDTKNYITNPGEGSFFVKINTYKAFTAGPPVAVAAGDVIDGGVTVANVMTDSIHITTKVLETMAFSVGTHNRDTDNLDGPAGPTRNGTCDAIQVEDNNRLYLGNPNAESSLETGRAWDVFSYWRLSSNSSGGATVYYSGDTLRNTVGDFIKPMDTTITTSNPGTEQFGLAFVDDSEMQSEVSSSFTDEIANDSDNYKLPTIDPLVKGVNYVGGSGNIGLGVNGETIDAQFAFDTNSKSVPAVIAQNNDAVLSCATAKMRYVGNIAADTPAGVYTTKINYLAAPQY